MQSFKYFQILNVFYLYSRRNTLEPVSLDQRPKLPGSKDFGFRGRSIQPGKHQGIHCLTEVM